MYKKLSIILISVFLLPSFSLAYSDYVIPGGESLGISIKTNGIMVIGFYKVKGKDIQSKLKVGDYITHINNRKIETIEDLTREIENSIPNTNVNIKYRRDKKEYNGTLKLVYEDNKYKTGLYVKDSVVGCGTLSYIDPESKIYGALGHEIIENNSKSIIEIKTGDIFDSKIISIDKSEDGNPGNKNASFNFDKVYGNINKNTNVGIFGDYTAVVPDKNLLKVALPNEVKIGKATIYTVTNNSNVESYEINITSINENNKVKNITFDIVDKKLLNKIGGIVQGMSGSPIIQNNKIIGAVTHVKVDDVKSGYGVFITTMLEEGDK